MMNIISENIFEYTRQSTYTIKKSRLKMGKHCVSNTATTALAGAFLKCVIEIRGESCRWAMTVSKIWIDLAGMAAVTIKKTSLTVQERTMREGSLTI
jgi:hypothetical protein